jgi:uncharacterized protein (TIGR02001 family)
MKIRTLKNITFAAVGSLAILVSANSYAGPMGDMKMEVLPPPPVEEEPWFAGELSAGWDSQYVFRGLLLNDSSLVWTGLDLAFYDVFSIGAWYANVPADDFTELDLYGALAAPLGPVDAELGFIAYIFPSEGADPTYELYGALGYTAADLVNLGLYAGYDFEIEGWYFAFTTDVSFDVTEWMSVTPYAGISYQIDYNADGEDFNNVDVGLSVDFALTDNATLSGYVAGALALDAIDNAGGDDEFIGGASLSVGF